MSLLLAQAQGMAERIIGEMDRFCDRIEIAGSVRRGRPHVSDLDFVVLLQPIDLHRFRERASLNSTVVKSGDEIYIVRLKDGTQVDFYFAHGPTSDLLQSKPGNFGSVFLCRTGSKEHNIYIAQEAKRHGYKWQTMVGITKSDGTILASETEEGIFRALDLPFIQPEDRERL